MLMRIPSDDGGLGVMGRETDGRRRGGLDENKQSARVPEEVHPPSPFLAASPDSYIKNKAVIEIKCPKVMEKLHPKELDKLPGPSRRAQSCELVDGRLRIKRDHRYYAQLMHQMFVCGVKMAIFVI